MPPPERPRAEPSPPTPRQARGNGEPAGRQPDPRRRNLQRRAALAAWRGRVVRALLQRLGPGDQPTPLVATPAAERWNQRERGRQNQTDRRDQRGRENPRIGDQPPGHSPALLLAWLAALVGLALALVLQSLLAPRWPRAERPRGLGQDVWLGDRRLRLVRSLPGQRDRDRALSETLVFRSDAAPPGRSSAKGPLELQVVAVQVRHRSDLAVPRLLRDRADLRLSGVQLSQATPKFSYGRGWLKGRPAVQSCLTGPHQGGYSERQLSRLRDQPVPRGWPEILYLLGLQDNREFSCLLLTLSIAQNTPTAPAHRPPADTTPAP